MKHTSVLRNILTLGLFLFISSGFAQDAPKLDTEKLDDYIEVAMEDWQVPGIGLAVVYKDQVLLTKGYGMRNIQEKLPVTANTLFAIGSSSKAFTATALCKLAQDGIIDLDEPLRTYLPDFELQDEYATAHMTPRDLLCHRSGLPRHDLVWYGSPLEREELFQTLKYLEPSASFREVWQYQNLMYMTAGHLIEEVSGESWEQYILHNFFNPLEMNSANTSVEESKGKEDYATGCRKAEKKVEPMLFRNIDAIGPAGSINASAEEMAHWVSMQLNGGVYNGEEVIGSAYLSQTHAPHMVVPGRASKEVFYTSYGLGWFLTSYRGKLRVSHGGNIDGFSAEVCLYPQDSIGVVLLTNMNGTGINAVIRNVIADELMGLEFIDWNKKVRKEIEEAEANQEEKKEEDLLQKKGTRPTFELEAYRGTYSHPAYGEVEIANEGDKLQVIYHVFREPIELTHYHYDVFQLAFSGQKIKFQFHTNLDGEIESLSGVLQQGVEPIVFEKKTTYEALTDEQLEVYVGAYELSGMTATVSVKDGELKLFVPGQPEYTLISLGNHSFELEDLEGFKAIFKVGEGQEKASAMVSAQPNGSFTFSRKEG
ncbi:MAG: serine hydrolase [Bacteroidota bacterium]